MFCPGDFIPASAHLEQALPISATPQDRSLPSLFSGAASVNALNTPVWVLWLLGYPDQALTRSHEMLTCAQELQHAFSLTRAQYTMAALHKLRGEADATQAEACFQQALAVRHKHRRLHDEHQTMLCSAKIPFSSLWTSRPPAAQ
jgi:hypothetical protein